MSYDYYTSHRWLPGAFAEQDKNTYMAQWRDKLAQPNGTLLEALRLGPRTESIDYFPANSFLLHTTFHLKTPYLSRDETDFYLLDHPVRKEQLFKTPMVAASSWKGALRAAVGRLDPAPDAETVTRIFGVVGDNEEGRAGCLYPFPSFFTEASASPVLEIINPHERETGIGTVPISLEAVPAGSKSTWSLAYVPPAGQDASVWFTDLYWLVRGVRAVLLTYGIGAKTSSGYGLANRGYGELVIKAAVAVPSAPAPPIAEAPAQNLPRYLETLNRLAAEFRGEGEALIDEDAYRSRLEDEGLTYNKKRQQLYEKAKGWWEEEGSQPEVEPEPKAVEEAQEEPVTHLSFQTLDELVNLADSLAQQLEKGGQS